MPLPSPRDREKRSEFIQRCMVDLSGKDEFKDGKQRAAVCYSQFKKGMEKASATVGIEDEEYGIFKEEADSSLWENIRKKRERIKRGSGEKMRKKGDKGAPTSEQIKKAKGD